MSGREEMQIGRGSPVCKCKDFQRRLSSLIVSRLEGGGNIYFNLVDQFVPDMDGN